MEGISLYIISFTMTGDKLAHKIQAVIKQEALDYEVFVCSVKKEATQSEYVADLKNWTKKRFEKQDALLFIGACGIAVRAIAPCAKDKLSDSPVVVMDEAGQFVIPVLSGHVGGANGIAVQIAKLLGAVPVITTATDVRGCLAIDVFAKNHNLSVYNREGIAKISAKVLEKRKVTVSIAKEYEAQVDIRITAKPDDTQAMLTCIPKEYIMGIGCRKGKEPKELFQFAEDILAAAGMRWNQIRAIATIDIKKEEAAIVQLSQRKQIPLFTFDANTLLKTEGTFVASDFVKQQVGVDNVCERAAIACCENGGTLVVGKQAYHGMTIAVAKEDWRLTLYEE